MEAVTAYTGRVPDIEQRPPDVVETARLRLERLRLRHAPELFAAVARTWETLHPWMPWALERPTLEGQQGFAESAERTWADGSDCPYVMLRDGQLVGVIGLHRRAGPETLEIGYWLDAAQTGQGLMTEATRALTEVALGAGAGPGMPGIDEVIIHCDQDNSASAGVPRRLGYELVGMRDAPALAPRETGRQQIWRMRRQDWPSALGR
jgi:RimJ/RimL family protein N-acetyltransferase